MNSTTHATANEPGGSPALFQGWYFYGITARDDRLAEHMNGIPGMPGGGALQVIEGGKVAALVQPVPLDEFGREALAARLEDIAWIEAAVRRHHTVIVAMHQRRALLPARFGTVYTSPTGVRAALAEAQDTLRANLERVAGCDEWEARLYGVRAEVFRHLDEQHPALAELREEMEASSPGRAYLLRRKLEGERERVAAASLGALAGEARRELEHHTTGSADRTGTQGARQAHPTDGAAEGEIEILRSDFLVSRATLAAFTGAMEAFSARHAGTRWVRSGPWPPYSFAAPLDTQPDVQPDTRQEEGVP